MHRIAIFVCAGSALGQNLIVNGDFEDNTAGTTRFNLVNANYSSFMANSTGFGTSDELDIITGLSLGVAPISGSWKVGMHERQGLGIDAFSLDLSQAVVAGQSYDISFWMAGFSDFGNPLLDVEIGLSNDAGSFGTPVFSGTATSFTAWNEVQGTFVAPVDASFLTVRNTMSFNNYGFIDDMSLSLVPAPGAALAFLVLGARRRR